MAAANPRHTSELPNLEGHVTTVELYSELLKRSDAYKCESVNKTKLCALKNHALATVESPNKSTLRSGTSTMCMLVNLLPHSTGGIALRGFLHR